jgi:hypothetical protein
MTGVRSKPIEASSGYRQSTARAVPDPDRHGDDREQADVERGLAATLKDALELAQQAVDLALARVRVDGCGLRLGGRGRAVYGGFQAETSPPGGSRWRAFGG